MRRAAIGLGLMVAMLCTQQAYAFDTCTFSDNATTVVHTVGTFASDSPQHDFLTDWIYLSHPDAWTCTRTTATTTKAQQEVILKAYMSPAAPVDNNFMVDGDNYGVYRSATVANSRIGFIVNRRYRIYAPGVYDWESPWLPVRGDTDNSAHPPGYAHYLDLPVGTSYTVSFETRIRLVKRPATGSKTNNFPRTGEAIEFRAARWWYWRASGGGLPERYTHIRVWFNRDDKTCTTPPSEKTVRLRDVETSAFSGEGSWAGETGFTLELSNCSSTVKKIKYKLAPVGLTGAPNYHQVALETTPWPLTPVQGTLPLGAGTTATGVHVQVLDGNGNPVKFDRTTMLVAPYTKGSGTASIPLQARYLQTGSTVTPGRVYATMSVLYMYK